MIEVKASIKNGERLRSYNAWNKEMPIVVKGVGGSKDCFQLPPTVRVIVPVEFQLPEISAKIQKAYINPEVALKKGLTLVCGVQLIMENQNDELIIENISESLVSISDGELLAFLVGGDV
jgi:hypothetical protein